MKAPFVRSPDPHLQEPWELEEAELNRLRSRRDSGAWYAVVGTGMLFMAGFSTALAVGGVFMVLFGGLNYLYWSRRITKHDDPWDDPEMDQWEEEHFDS